ncbi:MAG: hypothetical protein KY469_19820 [Actinobacteria bacterium]|nr:hypothetical protein [Actinomycetota bacterium]
MTDTLTPAPAVTGEAGIRTRARQLRRVVQRIAQDPHLPADVDPQRVMEETLKFLEVAATSDDAVSPSKTVDTGWHHFILFTRDYMGYGANHLGRFIHHIPDEEGGGKAETANAGTNSYLRTRQLIMQRFGDIDETIWPSADALADCQSQGKCSSDCSGDCSNG